MDARYSGLSVRPSDPPSMTVIVQPGTLTLPNRFIEIPAEVAVAIRPAGQRAFANQAYKIRGEGTSSPSWWNGEDVRGSGGAPYQRMVPGSLAVYSKDRDIRYVPDSDYTYDYHWGTVKRIPQGNIAAGEELSLDYAVWLCRYDAIVLNEDGTIAVAEGDTEAPDSRELLLPEPPIVKEGYVLAHVFTGWGQERIYGGNSAISGRSSSSLPVLLHGRYEDMVRRAYYVDVAPNAAVDGKLEYSVGATGEDYGTADSLTIDTLRWTNPRPLAFGAELPLTLNSAYGFEVDWGLSLTFAPSVGDKPNGPRGPIRYEVDAIPEMIFDVRPLLSGSDPLASVPLEQLGHLDGVKQALAAGRPTRIAFYGESASRSGLWPYQAMNGLRERYPDAKLYSSNVAVGGEQSVQGIHRLEREVLSLNASLIVLEYMINDACSGYPPAYIEQTVGTILERILASGAACMIVMANGVNPLFTGRGSARNIRLYYDLYRRLAAEYNVAFVGGYGYFESLHRYGKYYVTEFKGNMVNHTFGNEDFTWGPFDRVLSAAIVEALSRS